MIGKKGYYGKWCKCCGWDDHKLVKVRERRQWKKEVQEAQEDLDAIDT